MKYQIKIVNPDDTLAILKMENEGFRFLDRVFDIEISFEKTKDIRNKLENNNLYFYLDVLDKPTRESIELAKTIFVNDSRFVYSNKMDTETIKCNIENYIYDKFKKNKTKLFCVKSKNIDEPLGYAIVGDIGNNIIENYLGYVQQTLIGRASASFLYNEIMNKMSDIGYTKYIGRVSSRNISSLNLHLSFDGRIINIYDKYVKEKN